MSVKDSGHRYGYSRRSSALSIWICMMGVCGSCCEIEVSVDDGRMIPWLGINVVAMILARFF